MSSTDTYTDLINALPGIAPLTILSVFFLTLARILPIMVMAPFLGAKNLPMTVRMLFSLALVAIFYPQNILSTSRSIPPDAIFIGLMVKELLMGVCIGIFASAPFFVAQMSGSLIDHSRGSSSLQVNDPTTQSQSSPIGLLYNYSLIAIFFLLGGPFIFLNGVAESYILMPVDKLFNPDFFNTKVSFWKQAFDLGQHILNLAIQLASPALIGVLLTDLFLGIANRLAPQVQIVFLGMSLKSWVGIALMTVAWIIIIQVMGKEAIAWTRSLTALIQQSAFFVK